MSQLFMVDKNMTKLFTAIPTYDKKLITLYLLSSCLHTVLVLVA